MDFVPAWVIDGMTPAVIVAVTIWMVLTGRIVPRYVLQLYVKNAAEWKSAYEKQTEISETLLGAVNENTKTGAVVVKTMGTLQAAAETTTTEGPTP